MHVHHEPAVSYAQKQLPPRTWIELDDEELAMAVRHFAESNGIAVPNGKVRLMQRDHRSLTGVAMIVEQHDGGQLRLVE